MYYDNILRLYTAYKKDNRAPGGVDCAREPLGDVEAFENADNSPTHYVAMIMDWRNKVYKIDFDMQDVDQGNGTTNAHFVGAGANADGTLKYDVYTKFDDTEANWYGKQGETIHNNYIKTFIADRYGYTFLGWTAVPYTDTVNFNVRNHVFYDVYGKTAPEDGNVDDYIKKTYMFNFANYIESNVTEIENPDGSVNRTLKVYAWWQKNIYNISFNYNDYDDTKQYNDTNGLSGLDGFTFTNILGSSTSSKHTDTIQVTFDDLTGVLVDNVRRNGYIFEGFAIGQNLESAHIFAADDTQTHIYLSKLTAMIKTSATSLNTTDGYLYVMQTGDTLVSETLGDEQTGTPTIQLFALWTPIVYSVYMNVNTEGGSTNAFYKDKTTGNFVRGVLNDVFKVSVEFDTNEWTYQTGSVMNPEVGPLKNIEIGRFGYTWKGWYTSKECTTPVYTVSPDYTAVFTNNELYIPLQTSNSVSDETRTLTIYAGWSANTYNVYINNNEVGDATSLAYFENGAYAYTDTEFRKKDTFTIKFDSDDWVTDEWNNAIASVLMDRYGYSWKGLFPTTTSTVKLDDTFVFDLNLFKLLNNLMLDEVYRNVTFGTPYPPEFDRDSITDVDEVVILNGYTEKKITLHAQWTANEYTVLIQPNDASQGNGSTNATSATVAQKVTLGSQLMIPNVQRIGYDFIGWIVGAHKNGTDTPKFKAHESCILEAYGNLLNYTYLKETSLIGVPYLYNQKTGTDVERLGKDTSENVEQYEIYVYAYWVPKVYTVIFNANDSSNGNGSTKAYYKLLGSNSYTAEAPQVENATITFDKDDWTRVGESLLDRYGYRFNGWYNKPKAAPGEYQFISLFKSNDDKAVIRGYHSLGGEPGNYEDLTIDEDARTITLYANWIANKYTIKYKVVGSINLANCKELVMDADYLYKELIFDAHYESQVLTLAGYEFMGWSFAPYEVKFPDDRPFGIIEHELAIAYTPTKYDNGVIIPNTYYYRFGDYSYDYQYNGEYLSTYTNQDNPNYAVVDDMFTNVGYRFITTQVGTTTKYHLYGNANVDDYDDRVYERLGDPASESLYVAMYAVFSPQKFEIEFDLNKGDGTSTPYITHDNWANSYEDYRGPQVVIVAGANFTTLSYNKLSAQNIGTDRYGYTWTGWYLDSDTENRLVGAYQTAYAISGDENDKITLKISDVEQLVTDGIIKPGDKKLKLYAGWSANTYKINEFADPVGGSTDVYQVLPGEDKDFGRRYTIAEFAKSITFDNLITYNYFRIGYNYAGFSFINYGHYTTLVDTMYEKYVGNDKNFTARFGFDQVYIPGAAFGTGSSDVVCLYSSGIEDINSVGTRETLGDGFRAGQDRENFTTESFFVTLYVNWEAKDYTINISLNNHDDDNDDFDNYGFNDAGYALVMGSLDPMTYANDTILAYDSTPTNLIKYTAKFDQDIRLATTYIGMTPYQLDDFRINITGYTYQSLNTHFNDQYYATANAHNTVIVKGGVGQEVIFNDDLFTKLYYQSVREGNSVIKPLTESVMVSSGIVNYKNTEFYGDASVEDLFTLFAGYTKNIYSVTVENDASSEVKGLYQMYNSLTSTTDFTNSKEQNVEFYTTEHIVTVPEQSGYFLSKLQVFFTSSYNNGRYRFDLYLQFNSELRAVEIKTFTVYRYDEASMQWKERTTGTLTNDPTAYHLTYTNREIDGIMQREYAYTAPVTDVATSVAIDYVFNAIKIVSIPYNQKKIDSLAGYSNISYVAMQNDTCYTVIQIDNVKTDLEIYCSYALQQFTVEVEIVISDGTNVAAGQRLTDVQKHDYGTKVIDITSFWNAQLTTYEHYGWYYDHGASETVLVEEDFNKVINEDLTLKSYYKLGSSDSSKRVIFYHWDGEEDGNYTEYVHNENYILQGVSINYVVDENTGEGTFVTKHLGYQYEGGSWQWLDESEGYNYFNFDSGTGGSYGIDGGNPVLNYGRLKQIPTINSWYPDSQFICYVALTDDHIKYINETYGKNYIYMNQIADQQLFFRVTNYYSDGTVDIVLDGTGELCQMVDEGGAPIQVKLNKVPVLSVQTKIDKNIYAIQAYAIMNFTIENKDHFKLAGNTLTVDVDNYLDTVTFFEISETGVVYYEKSSEKVQMLTLNQTQYDAYVYAKAAGATAETALYNVMKNYSIDPSKLVALDPATPTLTRTLSANEYVFLFYYKKGGVAGDIITVCDTYFTSQLVTPGGTQTALEFYPTTNNVRFNADTISVTRTETKTKVDVNRENMRSSFVDKNGVVYTNANMRFVTLNAVQVSKFINNLATMKAELALSSVISEYSLSVEYETNFEIVEDSYIFAFYTANAEDTATFTVEKIACNYVYINFETLTRHLVYISELMFTSENIESSTYASYLEGYSVVINKSKMMTTKTDYSTGTVYNPSNLKFISFNGPQFRLFTDDVMNGFVTVVEALQTAIDKGNYTSIVANNIVNNLEFGRKYYILAYYENAAGDVSVVSMNLLEVVANSIENTETNEIKLVTLANALGFTIKSISTTKTGTGTTAEIDINIDYINKTFINYNTLEVVDQSKIKFIYLSAAEVAMIKEYYIASRSTHTDEDGDHYYGLRITYGSNYRDYKDLTLEQTLELVIYYYRNLENTTSNPFKDQLVTSDASLDAIIAGGYLPSALYPTSTTKYKLDTSKDETVMNDETGYYEHCMISYVLNNDGITIDKVGSNYLLIEYSKIGDIIDTINTSVITLDKLIFG